MTTAQGYSTLEWNPHQSRDDTAGIELDHHHRANRWDDEGRYLQPDTNKHNKYQGERHELSDGQAPGPDTDNTKSGTGRKFCGVSKRIFVTALAIGLLLIIGAIAGGIAGGLHKGQSATDKAVPKRNILQTTWLAAANRTIDESIQHTVVFQDSVGALLARYRITPSSREWKTVNLTLKFSSFIEEEKIELPAGAPLAATACADWDCGDTMVVYLGTDNVLHSIRDNDRQGSAEWYPFTDMAKANLSASNSSQLAMALSKSFHDEDGKQRLGVHHLLAYQDRDGYIQLSNGSSQWSTKDLSYYLPNRTTNTSLAIISQLRNEELDRVSLVAKAGGKTDATTTEYAMIEAIYPRDGTDNDWDRVTDAIVEGIAVPEDPSAESIQQFAVTMRHNWTDSVYLALSSNGTISGRIIGERNETIPAIQLRESGELKLANFSAIATTMDGMLYGFINDTISEYSFDTSDSSILNFEGVVYP